MSWLALHFASVRAHRIASSAATQAANPATTIPPQLRRDS